MINAVINRDASGRIRGFTVHNHGTGIVCAAVSMLVLNTVNSIEALTPAVFTCDCEEGGGFIRFALIESGAAECAGGAALLLDAMVLGLRSVEESYGSEIQLDEG
jgi:uncharacterized protein YsxB (DUF464 family)